MEERCPNNCVNGYYINPYTHKKEVCQYCLEKRRKEANTAEITEKLNLPPSLCGGNFTPDAIISDTAKKHMDLQSVKDVLDVCKKLIQDVSIGELPTESIMFNFGSKCKDNNFIAPFMRRAYSGGLTLTRVLTSLDIIKSRRAYSTGIEDDSVEDYEDILSKQVCMIIIDAGTSYDEILAIKGVMQLRGLRNLPTIMVTHAWNKGVSQLYNEDIDKMYSLATLYSIKYLKGNEMTTDVPSRLSLDDFKEHKNLNV